MRLLTRRAAALVFVILFVSSGLILFTRKICSVRSKLGTAIFELPSI